VRIVGDEYRKKNFTGRTYCEEKDWIVFNGRGITVRKQ
jgi:hypothetical protein